MDKKLGRLLQPSAGIFFVCLIGFTAVTGFMQYYLLAGIELGLTAFLLTAYLIVKNQRRKQLRKFLSESLDETGGLTGGKTPFPTLVVRLEDSGIVYVNDAFVQLTGFQDTMRERSLAEVLPDFSANWLLEGKHECPRDLELRGRRYRVYGTVIQTQALQECRLGVLYLTDLTELYQVRDEYIRSRPVVSIILIDNYEELTKNLTEGATAALVAKLNDAIAVWAEPFRGLLRRLERNRFLLVFEKRDLKKAIAGKFSLVEDVHEITNPGGLAASVSLGIGVDGETFEEAYEFAALSIEMALSRGGDQAVIKDRLNFNFYGGRNRESDRTSKVRSRVTANSLMELIGGSSQVFIMGHKNADMDSLGAAAGIYCMCRKKGKKAHIVLDLENNVTGKLIEELRETAEYKDAFVSGEEALVLCDNRSTLVVVDTNRPDQVENSQLLEAISRVCVVDHHRRAADYIKSVIVELHEPFASSAAELVTELLQYAVEKKDVLPIEAKCLMAGIFLDTKSFHVRTGERTFAAAGYLRQLGADTVEVKKLLQNDFQDTMSKYQIMKTIRMYRQELAIAALNTATSRTLAAQAADELLNISGITASFVLYPEDGRVFISARSIGDANVQMILEPLGGGGNTATAGAQIKDKTVKEVVDMLLASIDQFYEE